MANKWYLEALRMLFEKELDVKDDDLRVLLVMTNTTADTEEPTFLDDLTTLDEMDGAGYSRQTLDGRSITVDTGNGYIELNADPTLFSGLGAGTRQVAAAIIYFHVTDDTDSPPIGYCDTGGFPFTATGSNVSINWNAEGALQIRSAA